MPPARAGVVYTPADVTQPMVARALDELAAGRTATEILALRVCDPALGEGAFLLAAIARLAHHLAATGMPLADARAQLATRCVFGVDVDPRAVRVARAAIREATGVAPPAHHLQAADALALCWADAFPAVFAAGGFDVVVGNPPYIRQELFAAAKPALREFAVYDGVADLYVYFVELVHRLARPGGRWCLVLPNKWLTAAYARPLRAFLAAAGSVEGVVDFSGAPLFAEADAFPSIVWGAAHASARPLRLSRTRGSVAAALAGDVRSAVHDRARYRAEPWHIDAPEDAALLAQLEQRWPALGTLLATPPARGVVTGCNRAFVIDAATRARLVGDDAAAAAWIRPFVRGRDVRRWSPAPPTRYLLAIGHGTKLASLPRAIRAHLARFRSVLAPRPRDHVDAWTGRKPGSYAWHELQDPIGPLVASRAPRLLYQDIQTRPACSLDATGELAPDTTVWMLPTADRVLLAILNSSLYGWYARRRFPPALNGAVRPKRAYLMTLPIAQPPPALRAHIEALVDAQLAQPSDARELEIDAAVRAAYGLDGPGASRSGARALDHATTIASPAQRRSPPLRRNT